MRIRAVLLTTMRLTQERAVLTVARSGAGWAVQLDGELFGHSTDKEIAKAAAHRRARQMQDSGRACQVRVSGEHGFYGVF
jgi:hypothetical protein